MQRSHTSTTLHIHIHTFSQKFFYFFNALFSDSINQCVFIFLIIF